MGSARGAVYDGGGRRQEALAGRFLSKRVLPPAVGMEADGLSFFYAGREHAAIAPMREKYTAMYPATKRALPLLAVDQAVTCRGSVIPLRVGDSR